MLIITHRLKSSSEFMDRYLPDGPAGGFFLPQKLGMPLGSKICLELVLSWIDETYYGYATIERVGVKWDNCGRRERGCIVRLNAGEADLRRTLIERVRNSAEQIRQRGPERLPLNLRVHYFDDRRRARDGSVRDISATGALVTAPRPLPTGSELHLRFEDRRHQVMRHARGRVVRLDFSGEVAAMGVQFHFGSRRERRAMARMCAHLADQLETRAASAPPWTATPG